MLCVELCLKFVVIVLLPGNQHRLSDSGRFCFSLFFIVQTVGFISSGHTVGSFLSKNKDIYPIF